MEESVKVNWNVQCESSLMKKSPVLKVSESALYKHFYQIRFNDERFQVNGM